MHCECLFDILHRFRYVWLQTGFWWMWCNIDFSGCGILTEVYDVADNERRE